MGECMTRQPKNAYLSAGIFLFLAMMLAVSPMKPVKSSAHWDKNRTVSSLATTRSKKSSRHYPPNRLNKENHESLHHL